jgi:HAD superfamily hydrolase (TIGR01549 family)
MQMQQKDTHKSISATFIVNPVSGTGDPQERQTLLKKTATNLGWSGKYIETTKEITALSLAQKEVAAGVKHIVVCGGDGTVMEVLSAVRNTSVTVGIIPLGTGNLLCRNLALPLDIQSAMAVALLGNATQIDVGKANDTVFSIIAGIGLDAQIMKGANREMKNSFGLFAYVISAFKKLHTPSKQYQVTVDKKKPFVVKAKTIMAANMGKMMGGVEIVPDTHPQNGTLSIGIVKARTVLDWITLTLHAVLGNIDNSQHYEVIEGKHITIKSLSGNAPYECDGNEFPPVEVLTIAIYPKAVTVMVKPDELTESTAKKNQLLLFDFDGTLADSFSMVVSIYNALAEKHQYPIITPQKQQELRGVSGLDVIKQLPIAKVKLPLLYAQGKKEFERQIEHIKPFPELSHVLHTLSETYTLGIVTSNTPATVKKFLLNHQMDYFDFIYSDGSLFGKGKIITDVLTKYHYSKDAVMYIGDEVRDIEAGKSAGVATASVTWGFNTKELLISHQPDFLVTTPKELLTHSFFR